MLVKLQSAIALFTSGCLVCVAAAPNVGFVVTNGVAQVDGSAIRGNSTLFPGSLVQAWNGTSDLMFPGGANLLLQPDSSAKVYREYAVLQRGTAIQRGNHGLVADGLKFSPLSPQSSIVVGMKDASHLEVTASGGAGEVRNAAGALVAHLEPGKTFTFSMQDAQQTPSAPAQPQTPSAPVFGSDSATTQVTIRGILRKDHAGRYGHYLVTDVATKVTYELQGPGLDDLVGASVEAVGSLFNTAPAETASKVLSVADIRQMPLNQIPGAITPDAPAPTEAGGQPTPSGDTAPTTEAGADLPGTPNGTPAPEPTAAPDASPNSPPLVVHSDTAKIIVIVALAAGGAIGVALGLAGGKTSTVSPE